MDSLLDDAAARASRYLETLSQRGVSPSAAAVDRLRELDEPLPEQPRDPHAVLRRLDEIGSPATAAMAGGRYFGFVVGGALPASLAANWLATAWDQNAALHGPTPGVAAFEHAALRWLLEILDLPRESAGAFVTGATQANLCGLAAARHAVLRRAGWDVEADGLFGAPPIDVVVSAEAHPTLFKSLGVLGLGRTRDPRRHRCARPHPGRPDAGIDGAQHPLPAGRQREHRRLRSDRAALPAGARRRRVGPRRRRLRPLGGGRAGVAPLCAGLALADSWATDAHKWLNVPYDSGLAFVRDEASLRAAMSVTAVYLPTHPAARSPSDYTPELSRRARGVDVWAALSTLGRSGVAALIERCCRHARRFAEGLAAAGHEVLNDVVLNQVLVAFGDATMTRRVITALQGEGTCWCGVTEWQGRTAMRISVSSWATSDDDVELSLAAIARVAAEQGASRTNGRANAQT